MKDWIKMSINFMAGLALKWSSITWLVIANFTTLGILKFVADLSVSNTGQMSAVLAGELPITSDSLAIIFSVPYIILILISINLVSEKSALLYNKSVQSILRVSLINRIGYYLSGLTARFTLLMIVNLLNAAFFIVFILMFFKAFPQGIITVILTFSYVLIALIVIHDIFFLLNYDSKKSNTFTTIILVFIFVLNSFARPFISHGANNSNTEVLLQAFMIDLFMYAYLCLNYLITSDFHLGIFYTAPLILLIIVVNSCTEWYFRIV